MNKSIFDMLSHTSWNEIETVLYRFYAYKDEKEDMKSYKRLIWKLQNQSAPSFYTPIAFSFFTEERGKEEIEEENYSLAYEYIPIEDLIAMRSEDDWERFLSYTLETNENNLSSAEGIVHILFEFLHDETL